MLTSLEINVLSAPLKATRFEVKLREIVPSNLSVAIVVFALTNSSAWGGGQGKSAQDVEVKEKATTNSLGA